MEFILVAVVVIFAAPSSGFNVDTSKAMVFTHPDGAKGQFFGYSVALYSSQNKYWVLAGAPLSDVKASDGKELKKFGGIYKCSTTTPLNCQYIPIDNKPNHQEPATVNSNRVLLDIEEKENQWLGGVLHSTGKDGKVVTCAPRYIFRGMPSSESGIQYRNLLGRCFQVEATLFGAKPPINPCYDKTKGNNFYGYCQAGFSAQTTINNDYIAMGAVGITNWKGGMVTYAPLYDTFKFTTQDQINNGYYMGYSITSGYFGQSKIDPRIAGGAPRAENLKGKVLIYQVERQLTVSATLPQPKNMKMGSYFGSVLCAVDLNNDKYTDILVGAPLYSDFGDEGRVFVYMNNQNGALNLMSAMDLTGDKVAYGRFGSAISNVGDLNADGYQDVVIGAPYEGKGAVYIYHGKANGIDTNYKQKILASDIGPTLSHFGQSISGGVDVDGNGYPDFAVGAYGSDNAVLLKTQKVIDVEAEIHLSVTTFVLENNKTQCKESDGSIHKCLNMTACFTNSEKKRSALTIAYKLELDKDKRTEDLRRMYFYNNTRKSFTISGQRLMPFDQNTTKVCLPPHTVHLRKKSRLVDLLSVLTFEVSFDLADLSCKNDPNVLCPVLNNYKSKRATVKATFQKECGSNICKPDLLVTGELVIPGGLKAIHIGTVNEVTLLVDVKNKANDAAYLAQVIISYPSAFEYIGPRASDIVQCVTSKASNGTETASCNIGNPLKGHSNKTVGIKFGTPELANDFTINIQAKSVNVDVNDGDNAMKLKVAVKFAADLEVIGSSLPNKVLYEGAAKEAAEIKTQSEIGPKIATTIIVQNNGPSKVDGSQLSVNVPYRYDEPGTYLLYMLQVELTGASGSCSTEGALNPLRIPVGNKTTGSKGSKRKRREAIPILSCRTAQCKSFTCRFGLLEPGEKAEVTIRSRLWQSTLIKKNPSGSVDIHTWATISIPDSRYTQPNTDNDRATIVTTASTVSTGAAKQTTPWWVYFLAALGGVLLLVLAAFVMYKFGFFKRKRVKDISNPQTNETMAVT